MKQLTCNDPEFATLDVLIQDTLIPKELVIAADADAGKVWCWQVDVSGAKLKTVELKQGVVTIRPAKT